MKQKVLLVVILMGSALIGCVSGQIIPNTAVDGTSCTFTYESVSASAVSLVGDFNNWDPASLPMRKAGGKTWILRIQLPQGIYQYRFIVNHDTPVTPPHAQDYASDGYGGRNAVVIVKGRLPGQEKRVTE